MTVCVTCKYCGKANLAWRRTPDGWRLADRQSGIHLCDKRLTTPKEIQA